MIQPHQSLNVVVGTAWSHLDISRIFRVAYTYGTSLDDIPRSSALHCAGDIIQKRPNSAVKILSQFGTLCWILQTYGTSQLLILYLYT